MEISVLSNQWKTRERLLASFDGIGGAAMRQLLLALEKHDGPRLWAGTSHSQLNLTTRDAHDFRDRAPSFVRVYAYDAEQPNQDASYQIECRKVIDFRPTNEWVTHKVEGVETAVKLILDALKYAESPQRNTK